MSDSSRRYTSSIAPGTPLDLAWDDASCRGEAIVMGGSHAMVLAPASLTPGAIVTVANPETGQSNRFSVLWCGHIDGDGRYKIGLELISD